MAYLLEHIKTHQTYLYEIWNVASLEVFGTPQEPVRKHFNSRCGNPLKCLSGVVYEKYFGSGICYYINRCSSKLFDLSLENFIKLRY